MADAAAGARWKRRRRGSAPGGGEDAAAQEFAADAANPATVADPASTETGSDQSDPAAAVEGRETPSLGWFAVSDGERTEAEEAPSDIDVRLEWPEGAAAAPLAPSDAWRPSARVERGPVALAPPLLPSLAADVHALEKAVASLATQLESVNLAIHGVGSVVSDRLVDYTETISRQTAKQSSTFGDYHAATQRALVELRDALAASDDLVQSLVSRVDELGSELEAVTAHTDAAALVQPIGALHSDVTALRGEVADVRVDIAEIAEVEEAPSASAAGGVDSDELILVRDEIVAAFEATRDELSGQLASVAERASALQPTIGGASIAVTSELAAIRDELAQLKRRLAVRAKSSMLDDEQVDELAVRVAGQVRLQLSDAELTHIGSMVAEIVSESFEVVVESPPPPPAAAPTPAASPTPAAPAPTPPPKKSPPKTPPRQTPPAARKTPPPARKSQASASKSQKPRQPRR
jgi:predicted  nucleic acid-binding Zn-ribbon protein